MISLTYNDLANGLHVALGALFVVLPSYWGLKYGWPHAQLWGSCGGFLYGIIKEFFFDLEFEDEATSGGLAGGMTDLLGYIIGIGAANLILWL